MVITTADGSFPDSSEPSESVKDPPIRRREEKSDVNEGSAVVEEKVDSDSTTVVERVDSSANTSLVPFNREQLCKNAHVVEVEHLAELLGVDFNHGLTVNEAATRLAKDGPNKIKDTKRISMFQIFLRQIANSLTIVLAITLVLSFSLDDYIEGSVITAVVLLNIIVGFVQDYRAEQTILSLQALSSPECKVLRNGQIQVIKAETLVIGDIVSVSAGGVVPADLRLFDSMNLSTDEALLTGESLPISKHADAKLPREDMPIGDRINMVYSASMVTRGRGLGIVIATSMLTEVGKIAALLQDKKPKSLGEQPWKHVLGRAKNVAKHALGLIGSPLQVKLSKFALLLFALAITLAIIVFSVALWDVTDEVLIYGICVAVAVIPESLLAVLTLTIAVGTKAMAKSNIIIRRLSSLEAVGGVTNICSDKTGTLTQGKMIVRRAAIAGGDTLRVCDTSSPLDPTSGTVQWDDLPSTHLDPAHNPELLRFLDTVSLCNLSQVQQNGETSVNGGWTGVGEPTEIALQVFAMRFEHGKPEAMAKSQRSLVAEFPFDSSIKRMTMVYSQEENKSVDVFTKGATEALLPILTCSESEKERISQEADEMAADGLRVLCLAHKNAFPTDVEERSAAESDLTFVGLIGLYDPPRVETADAVRTCQSAGITVHMLTGDHIKTATAIANEVGIISPRDLIDPLPLPEPVHLSSGPRPSPAAGLLVNRLVMTAGEFDKLSNDEIDSLQRLPLVIARCSPTTKVRMVQALHRRQAFCIMTGDGINDSPALKLADIGIAMGLNGSDVAKQAADMVLADDNFASIVRAIAEGRRLFDNIQKFLLHLLTSNISQVLLLLIGLAFKDGAGVSIFPLSPLEILWVNLVTSSPLALGLGLEPAVSDIMSRPPRDMKVGVFTKALIVDKMVYGGTIGALSLVAFSIVVYAVGGGNLGHLCNDDYNSSCDAVFSARATVFAFLTFGLLIVALEVTDFRASLFNMPYGRSRVSSHGAGKLFSIFPSMYRNRFLFWSVIAGLVIVFPLIYLPVINLKVFKHQGITWEWGIVIACVVLQICTIEAWKWAKRGRLSPSLRDDGTESGLSTPKGASEV